MLPECQFSNHEEHEVHEGVSVVSPFVLFVFFVVKKCRTKRLPEPKNRANISPCRKEPGERDSVRPLTLMETLDVPELLELPDPAPYDKNPVTFADYVLTSLFRKSPALLHAKYRSKEETVTWFVRPRATEDSAEDSPIVASPSCGSFRAVLARFGHHYLGGQLYGGYAVRFLQQHGRVYRCYFYMSNGGQPGSWIRVYAAVYPAVD